MSRLQHLVALWLLLLLLRLWQLLGLAPVSFNLRRRVARCRHLITTASVLHWLVLLALSPLLLLQSVALYDATNVQHSTLFRHIALGTMAGDTAISLTVLLVHLLQRQRIAKLVTALARLQRWISLSCPAILLLCGKLLLSFYELLCNLPFLQQNAARLPWSQLLAYGIQLYVQHISSVFSNGFFAGLLLILASLQHAEQQWQQQPHQTERLLQRDRRLLQLCQDFIAIFQLDIFLLVVGSFVNILANMYAYMSYFVEQHGVPLTISNYCLIVAIQLYTLVYATHLCQLRHKRLLICCLEQSYTPQDINYEQAVQPTPLLVWPLDGLNFSILGLFTLDHTFLLFLIAYATNFIVLIAQFTLENVTPL